MSEMQDPESQTRLSVIMFSDIVGYSKMMNEDEQLAMTLLSRHNEVVRDALKKHEGKEIKVIGDAFLVSFATVANAVRCAIDIQERFGKYNENAPEREKTQVRIGIHMGDIIVKDDDVFGDGVNIASRIEPLAEPGGICISQEIYNMVKHKLDIQVVSLGPKELKNIKDKIEIYEILVGSITSDAHRAKTRKKQRRNWVYALAGLFVVAIGLLIAVKTLNKPMVPMVTRIMGSTSSNVVSANISPDGNWIVYVDGNYDIPQNLYIVHSSGGEPRKVTNDTTYIDKSSPSFSPDASQIVYERGSYQGGNQWQKDICVVPMLGGASRKLVSDGERPAWSPNGKYIAFFRNLPSIPGMGLFIVNPEGTGETKLAQINPLFRYNVAWSPDSKRLAFLRSFRDGANNKYTEIFSRELNDTTEHQITFDKKLIDDFCWTPTGEIVFNSTRGGGVGLWVMPEDGGTPKQLTLGAGTDIFPRISRDAKRLVYLNESQGSNLWTMDLRNNQIQQLTFEDGNVIVVSYSWDGNKISYWRKSAFESSQTELVVCNKDGTEPVRLTPSTEGYKLGNMASPRWSGDSKSVFLSGYRIDTVRKKNDSTVTRISFFEHEIATNVTHKIGDGAVIDISRDGKFVLCAIGLGGPSPRTVLAFLSSPDKILMEKAFSYRPDQPQFSWDSKSVLIPDSNGIWFIPVNAVRNERFIKTPKHFLFIGSMPDGKSLLGVINDPASKNASLVKFYPADGRVEKITKWPERSMVSQSTVSPDGKTLVFKRLESRNRIVVLDNFR